MITDNMPYNSKEFIAFSKEYQFDITTSSPHYPRSNGLSEMAVKIVKRILKKCDDPCIGLLEYLNTPITGLKYSPTQLLMNRSTRSIIPMLDSSLKPQVPTDAHAAMLQNKKMQQKYHDRTAKELQPLEKDETVRIKLKDHWEKAKVMNNANTPRSYNVMTENGQQYRRNRQHLLKTNESEPFKITHNPDFSALPQPTIEEDCNPIVSTNNETTDSDITPEIENSSNTTPIVELRRSTRERKAPTYLNDYA